MRLRKVDAKKAQMNGLMSEATNHMRAINMLKAGVSPMEVAKQLDMYISDVYALASRIAA